MAAANSHRELSGGESCFILRLYHISRKVHFNSFKVIFGRLFIALSSGAYCLIIPIYVGEMASKEIRGMLLMFFDLSIKLGALFSYILFSYSSTFVVSILCGTLAFLYMFGIFYLPETPLYHFRKEQFGLALESIRRIRGESYNFDNEIKELQKQSDELDATKELKKPARRKSLLIIICMFFFMQLSGINVILFYAPTIFMEAGVKDLNPMIIIYLVQMLAVLATFLLIDRYGRKILLISSLIMMMIGLIGNGTAYLLGYEGIEWILLFFLIIFIIGFSLGISGIPFVLFGELFTLDAKRIIAPTALTLNFAFAYFVALIFTLLANWIRVEFIFFAFAIICLIGLMFVLFFVPETKGKTLLEIQMELRGTARDEKKQTFKVEKI
jgi:MFS family permease